MNRSLLFIFLLLFTSPSLASQLALNDNWIGEPASSYGEVKSIIANHYMVSTDDKLASSAAAKILDSGGDAVDAAIAAQMVLNVTSPEASGIGGGGFILYYDAKSKRTTFYNGRETAPEDSRSDMFLGKDGKPLAFEEAVKGGRSVATPSLLKMLKELHDKHGKLPWANLFQPAIKVARIGFHPSKRLPILSEKTSYLKEFAGSREMFFDQNNKFKDIITNQELANTFDLIATKGITPFYNGKIAQNIVDAVQKSPVNAGFLKKSDLENYKITTGEPACKNYRSYKICSAALPSSGGITLLQILGILENFDLKSIKPSSPEAVHLISEATRLGYADRNRYIGDPKFTRVPVKEMLDKSYLKKRAELIKLDATMANAVAGNFDDIEISYADDKSSERPSTTHISIIDKNGNAIAFTSSVEYFFGSGILVDGFFLNNQMTDFSFLPMIDGKPVANSIAPFKAPRSSMSPTLVFDKDGKLRIIIGSPGGPRIIQYTLKVIIGVLDWGLNIQQAILLPNHVVLGDFLELENHTPLADIAPALIDIGHKVKMTDLTSGINSIQITEEGKIIGGADPRREASAIGK